MHRVFRSFTVAAACLAIWTLGAGAAWADCHGNSAHDNGYKYAFTGAVGSEQDVFWELGGIYGGRGVRVMSRAGASMSTDICLDSLFDWMTLSGHFDARVARNCAPDTERVSDSGGDEWQPDDDWGNRTLTGIQKGAGCKYLQTTNPPSYGTTCYDVTWAVCSPTTASPWTALSQRVWVRHQDTTIDYNSGGDTDNPAD